MSYIRFPECIIHTISSNPLTFQYPALSNPSTTDVTLSGPCRCQFELGYSTTVTVSVTVSSHQTGWEQLFLSPFFAASHFQGSCWYKCHSPLWWAALTWVVAPTKLARRALRSRLGGAQEQPNTSHCSLLPLSARAMVAGEPQPLRMLSAFAAFTYSGTIAEATRCLVDLFRDVN